MSVPKVGHFLIELELSEWQGLLLVGDGSAGVKIDCYSEPIEEISDTGDNHTDWDEKDCDVIKDEGSRNFKGHNSKNNLLSETDEQSE